MGSFSKCVDGNDHLAIGALSSVCVFLDGLEYVGGKVTRAALAANAWGNVFGQCLFSLYFAMQGYAFFNDFAAAVFACLALPEIVRFHVYSR